MNYLERILTSFTLILLLSSLGLAFLIVAPVYADVPYASQSYLSSNSNSARGDVVNQDLTPPTFPPNPLITPTNGITVTNPRPPFDWLDASDPGGAVVSYTVLITGSGVFTSARVTTTASIYTPTFSLPNDVYTWTVQAHDAAGNVSATPPATFTLAASYLVYLPLVFNEPGCPTTSSASFDLIPIDGSPADHPDYLHADLNLALRGYAATSGTLGLVDYNGGADPNAPQLAGLFEPNRLPGISTVYQINHWIWSGCGTHGCRGSAITDPPVTLAGFVTTPGEAIYIPERGPEIYGGGYKVMVLYAEEKRITLGYTRQDTVVPGYVVHIENVCVDPNLLTLYQAQTDADGWHATGYLPALRNNQALGTAFDAEVQVAIRDRGTFMDPRSRKDWWQGY
jgi:hypothetical protein